MPGAFLLYEFLRGKNLVQLSRQEKDLAMDRCYKDCNGFGKRTVAA
jgi:hypothetical protein